MAKISNITSHTFSEYYLLPGYTPCSCEKSKIDIGCCLARGAAQSPPRLKLEIPFASAMMQSVSGEALAISLARQGGLSFVYHSQPVEAQCAIIRNIKSYKAGFVRSDSNLPPTAVMSDVLAMRARTGHNTILITEGGSPTGRLHGILTRKDYRESRIEADEPVGKYMTPLARMTVMEEPVTIQEANNALWEKKVDCVVVVSNGCLSSLVFRKDYYNHKRYNYELTDSLKRYAVGAGINTRDYEERVPALLDAGADALCVDSSDGYTEWQERTLRFVRDRYGDGVIVGGGNVVTAEGFRFLADCGADFVKVGMGGGAICITREQKGVGRGQATALMDVAAERDRYFAETGVYVPVCSDGGIVHDYHIALALAMGADFVMLGRYFARFDESNSERIQMNGNYYKEYWGEGSFRAKNLSRYVDDPASGQLFEEGVDAYVPYAGKLDENIVVSIDKIKSIMSNCGANSLAELREKAVLELISGMSFVEGGAHDVILRNNS
ncbi:MAG: IMP dehydrogenase [Clostridiales bacterium]|jgi:IMP dehydrogenase|nr:IMP dehydrogenase [Clostridiales bacterium]